MTIADYTERALVPEIDTTVASQSSYMKVFTSNVSFQDVCGELIGMVQVYPVQRPPFTSNLLRGAFRVSSIIQEMKIT